MTSCILFGFLGVRDGRRESFTKKNKEGREIRSSYTLYSTSINPPHGDSVSAILRNWTPSSESFYPDDSIVFVIAKLYAPANQSFLLECLCLSNFPGDPEHPTYGENIPDLDSGPFVIALGQVVRPADPSRQSLLKTFTLGVSDYVRDEQRYSNILWVSFFYKYIC